MPNWCWNNLIISPSDSDESGEGMKRLRAKLLFMVEDMTANPKVWGGSYDYLVGRENDWDEIEGWYYHNLRVYGSKWQKSAEDFIEAVEDDGECITMGFQSAWSPVVGFTQLLSSQYRLHIEHTFDETGDWYAGKLVVDSGEILEEFCLDYYAGTYKIDEDLFWHEIRSNMECWVEDDEDEARSQYASTLKQLDFLSPEELKQLDDEFNKALTDYQNENK
jgi:hypothetical protein